MGKMRNLRQKRSVLLESFQSNGTSDTDSNHEVAGSEGAPFIKSSSEIPDLKEDKVLSIHTEEISFEEFLASRGKAISLS